MKLRNKKTGEIWDIPKMRHPTVQEDDISFFAMLGTNGELFSYRSIAELNEEWEDYTPKEPLIKDEKIRKAVRAWAEACDVEKCHYDGDGDFATRWHGIKLDCSQIELDEGHYTIAELCGEEENEQ